jgi:hypothetical protein
VWIPIYPLLKYSSGQVSIAFPNFDEFYRYFFMLFLEKSDAFPGKLDVSLA